MLTILRLQFAYFFAFVPFHFDLKFHASHSVWHTLWPWKWDTSGYLPAIEWQSGGRRILCQPHQANHKQRLWEQWVSQLGNDTMDRGEKMGLGRRTVSPLTTLDAMLTLFDSFTNSVQPVAMREPKSEAQSACPEMAMCQSTVTATWDQLMRKECAILIHAAMITFPQVLANSLYPFVI